MLACVHSPQRPPPLGKRRGAAAQRTGAPAAGEALERVHTVELRDQASRAATVID